MHKASVPKSIFHSVHVSIGCCLYLVSWVFLLQIKDYKCIMWISSITIIFPINWCARNLLKTSIGLLVLIQKQQSLHIFSKKNCQSESLAKSLWNCIFNLWIEIDKLAFYGNCITIGMLSAHNSPPSLTFICKATFCVTLLSFLGSLIVFAMIT